VDARHLATHTQFCRAAAERIDRAICAAKAVSITVRVDHWTRVGVLREGVKYLLHIIVLFELVDHRQNFRCLFFRQLGRNRADVFVLG
jgi:hypothetical protein